MRQQLQQQPLIAALAGPGSLRWKMTSVLLGGKRTCVLSRLPPMLAVRLPCMHSSKSHNCHTFQHVVLPILAAAASSAMHQQTARFAPTNLALWEFLLEAAL
jgi:hypothetical protein